MPTRWRMPPEKSRTLRPGVLGEVDGGEQALDLGAALARIVQAALQGPVVEELLGGEVRVGVELLRQEADPPPVLGQVVGRDRHAAEEDVAAGGLQEAGEDAQKRRLAGAVRAEQADDAGRQREADGGEGR